MKLMRYGDRYGAKIPCIQDAEGVARDASSIVADFGPRTLSPELMERLRATDPASLPVADIEGERLAPPVAQPFNIWCVGLNYSDHAAEAGMPIPGDLICTGTPPGVGDGMKPPRYLKIGDTVTLGIEGLGEQRQAVVPLPE